MSVLKWWQKAVFYQIYPRSFADGNGDGIGDLKGMISKLDYLAKLGIDAIWLSPHYPSPQFDCGYDVADYVAVDPDYGTLFEFKSFLDGCHQRGIRLILDLVLNHTSHMHQWFIESRSSRNNPKRDWYIWMDGKNGEPPNNWYSSFGGSAWEYDPETDQYYYHFFFKEQPDLNWRNPEVKQAMFNAVRFWLEMGVDGYRLDALGTLFEHPDMPDHNCPLTQIELYKHFMEAKTEEEHTSLFKHWETMFKYQTNFPGIHDLFKELRQVVNEFPDRLLVAEDDDIAYMGNGQDEMDLVFNFPLMRTPKLTPSFIRQNQTERLQALAAVSPGAWPCNTLGNHDSPRMITSYGDGEHDTEIARLNLALLLTLKGTPFLYNGEEIGIGDYFLDDIRKFRDMLGVWTYNSLLEHLQMPAEQALQISNMRSRDKNRTPMQWSNAPNAGFCPEGIAPWLPVSPSYAQGNNVADQENDPGSMLNYYRTLINLRKSTPALIAGDYIPLAEQVEDVLAFTRTTLYQNCLVALNYSGQAKTLELSIPWKQANLLYTNHDPQIKIINLNRMILHPYEVLIAELK
jgi:alpha-glucosidase